MILLGYFAVLFLLLLLTRRPSPSWVLAALYCASLICGVLIDFDYHLNTSFEFFNLAFTALILTLFIVPWQAFRFRTPIRRQSERRVTIVTTALICIHSVGFVVFSIAFYYAIGTASDYSAFKNGGESIALNATLPINHWVYLLSSYLNSSAAFLIPLPR